MELSSRLSRVYLHKYFKELTLKEISARFAFLTQKEVIEMKRRMILIPMLALMMLVAVAPAMSVVYATKLINVSGTFHPAGIPVMDEDPAGKSDNVIIDVSVIMVYEGGIAGKGIEEGRWIVHNYGLPSRWDNAIGVTTLIDAVVEGKKGDLTIKHGYGVWRIISGTGELANLHGEGTSEIISFPLFAYIGQVHFAP